jgi:hypothetical protein
MDIAGQSGQKVDILYMLLLIQNGLPQMGNAPPLRDIIPKNTRQFLCRFPSHRISPCTEGHQKFPFFIKRHIPMHHSAESDAAYRFQGNPILLFHVLCQPAVAFLQPFPDHIQAVSPNVVLILIFPFVVTGCNRGMVFPNQYRFNPRRS